MLKKFSLLIFAFMLIIIFTASDLFADIPANHWARNAVTQLAAKGIITDINNFMGDENSTRYEFAAMLSRILETFDFEKADNNDMAALKKLVDEFKSELEILGANVSKITGFKNNLSGWRIHGQLRLDVTGRKQDDGSSTPQGEYLLERARLFFERKFDDSKFVAMIDDTNIERFYIETPFVWGANLIAGRFKWDFEYGYHIEDYYLNDTGGFYGLNGLLTDRVVTGLAINKTFSNANFRAYVAHPMLIDNDWEIAAALNVILNERIALDLGLQVFLGENTTQIQVNSDSVTGHKFEALWTFFAGLKLDFGDNIFLRGIIYDQKLEVKDIVPEKFTENNSRWGWRNADEGNFRHWAVILELPQEVLRVFKLWLEYGHFDKGFKFFNTINDGALFLNKNAMPDDLDWDLNYLRVAFSGEFKKNFGWHIFYYKYNFDAGGFDNPFEAGVGLTYRLNDSVSFGINYIHSDNGIINSGKKDDFIRFRTDVNF